MARTVKDECIFAQGRSGGWGCPGCGTMCQEVMEKMRCILRVPGKQGSSRAQRAERATFQTKGSEGGPGLRML